jgi:predicted esterase
MRGLGSLVLLGLTAALSAQSALTFQPPKVAPPDADTLATIESRADRLEKAIDQLQRLGVHDPALADIEVYLRAGRMIVKHGEFFKDTAKHVVPVLDQGLLRASQQARGETPWYGAVGQTVARGYRSRLDGTVQPYAVTYPHDYGQDKRKRYRVDVVLHGRDSGLSEVSFLYRNRGGKPAPKDLSHVRIDIFGRGNNAYRWAGETDVFEAVQSFFAVEGFLGREGFVDRSRVVLRGYSMGGAGTWHIGLHRPDQWVVLGPGAGFTTTRGYVAKLPEKLPDYQEACLHIYDAADYAENAFDVPIVAYNGDEDPQIQSARNIEALLKPLGLSMTHYVAPKLKHQQPPSEYAAKLEADYAKYAAKGKPEYPEKVRFVTWTLKYPGCYWVELLGLDRHYVRARVEADRVEDGFRLKTDNVRSLRLAMWPGATREPANVVIDGQKLVVRPSASRTNELFVYLEKQSGKWAPVLAERLYVERLRSPRKSHGLQGPIDDAFSAPFLCVRGTGTPWHDATEQYAKANLERFKGEWSKYLRGDLPVKDDSEVTAEDLATKHLILFGDPGSNSLIEQALPKLPVGWTKKSITFAGADHDAATHVPVMIYPSPLAADRYIVLNSGHTFHAREFQGTNALLYPRLGDHAVLKLAGAKDDPLAVEVVRAGLFDDDWRAAK